MGRGRKGAGREGGSSRAVGQWPLQTLRPVGRDRDGNTNRKRRQAKRTRSGEAETGMKAGMRWDCGVGGTQRGGHRGQQDGRGM